jgi:ABC-type multidrug transport system fused ATPase/permease subunit
VLERIDRAVALGDRLLVGGTVPRQFEAGAWFRPALIAPAANDSPAVQEEFFAPVLTVQTFATAAEALTLADSTPFGLALYVWSRSPEMIAAARRAEAHDFILTLEDPQGRRGYDAHVGERGVKLSGGQRQRVALARVILKDAPILILDEATSALDSEAEAAIQDALYGVMQGKTVIAIAHRLSTIAAMDRIVVLEDGHIAEQGTHAALLAQNGLYARFWARQSGGFIGLEEEAAE